MILGRPKPPSPGLKIPSLVPAPAPGDSAPRDSVPRVAGGEPAKRPGGSTIVTAYAAESAAAPLVRGSIERRAPEADDVSIAIDFCGLCHSDVHTVRSEWGVSHYPLVPGHEIVGRVMGVGSAVTGFKPGDRVGVGAFVDSCRECVQCAAGLEQFCETGYTGTANARDRRHGGMITKGGYSTSIVVHQAYVLRIPSDLDPAAAAPLLCAGITTYSPLRRNRVQPGDRVGVVGLGGLGHLTVKMATAMGATVTVFTRSAAKKAAARSLGAADVVISTDAEAMRGAKNSLNLIIDTVCARHDLDQYLATLKLDGTLVQLGLPPEPMPPVTVGLLVRRRLNYTGSMLGGIGETQEMLDFCAAHAIVADIELVSAGELNSAYDRLVRGDVRYRFVLENSTLDDSTADH